MSRFTDIRSGLRQRGKSLVGFSADLVEWSAEKNLAIAGDVASFVVAQMRLSVEARDLSEYRSGMSQSVFGLGETLLEHGQDYAAKITGLPKELWRVVRTEPRRARQAHRKPASPVAAKKKAAAKTRAASHAA